MRWCYALLALAVLTGCGVPTEDRPQPVRVGDTPVTTDTRPTSEAREKVVGVYLLRRERLALTWRSVPNSADVERILSELPKGPTPQEAAVGYRTAVLPGPIRVVLRGSVADVDVTSALTDLAGDDQLQAFAQIVWTVTQHSSARSIRMFLGGDQIRVPTDLGLMLRPVTRADWSSLAPAGTASQRADG